MLNNQIKIGIFPFGGKENPYQELTRRALSNAGLNVTTFPKCNLLPLTRACAKDIDILHIDWAHSLYSGATPSRALLKWLLYNLDLLARRRKPIVWTLHNERSHNPTSSFEDRAIEKLIRNISGAVFLSKHSKTTLAQTWPTLDTKPHAVIPHGNYIDWYPHQLDKKHARLKLDISDDKKVALFLGRVQPYKGIETLISSFKSIDNSSARLIIAGKPTSIDFRDHIRNLASTDQRIKIKLEHIPDSEIQQYFAAADFSVLPFKKVLNSGSAILSMSFSTPILAPKLGSLPETTPTDGGILYNSEATGLQEALETAFNMNHYDLAAMGKACFERAQSHHDWKQISEKLAYFYQTLCRAEKNNPSLPTRPHDQR